MFICKECHKRIHGKKKIELPAKDEIVENNS